MSDVNTKQIKEVADKSETVGNDLYNEFQKSKKLETAKVAIAAFRNTLYANSLLIKTEKIQYLIIYDLKIYDYEKRINRCISITQKN